MLARTLDAPVVAADALKRLQARKLVIRRVEDTIGDRFEGSEAEAMHAELMDRLDGPDLDDDIATRPLDEVVREICHDLGIRDFAGFHPWQRRTPADLAALRTRAAAAAGTMQRGAPLTGRVALVPGTGAGRGPPGD